MWIHVVFCMITKIFMYFNVKINGYFVEISMNICHTIINTFKGDKFLYRKIMRFLESWKESKYRKPLILQGARQVGKTYSILEFGRTYYENVAYFNFETNPKLNETFEENISPDYLIPILSHIAGQTIVREKTLIVFDEVQLCERALTSLKYFCEDAPGYHIIAAGSLLFVAAGRARFSFPVGKADMKILYPMDMEEFMLAMGEGSLVEQIKKCFAADVPLPSALHHAAMGLYRQYLVVGGMAENYVNVQLSINGYSTYYWESDRGAEIDFVIQREGKMIPIEVKSADNTKAKSLKVYMETYKPDYAIKLSAKNFGFEDGKKTVPLYAAFCI